MKPDSYGKRKEKPASKQAAKLIKRQKLENGAHQKRQKLGLSKKKAEKKEGQSSQTNNKKGGKERLKNAVLKWERLRRHDTTPEEKSELVAGVLKQVEGRIVQTATSPTGSRVLQACIKHSNAEQRSHLLHQILPHILDLSKQPYGHFLVRRLIALASKEDQKAVLSAVKGHVPMLLRHPCGASIIDELYNVISAQQRNHLAAEFYGREYTLLSQEAASVHLSELLEKVDASKRRIILQRMAMHLVPIMEKALVDPVLTHRLIAEYLEASRPAARLEAFDSLTGEALLRMVHTRNGAWIANAVLCYGTAKHCKAFLKAIKGHVKTMAQDKWGSLVLASALSHVDDTVLLRKCVLLELQDKAAELMADKHGRLVFLQLLAPNKARYLQAELLSVVNPTVASPTTAASNSREETQEAKELEQPAAGGRLKDHKIRRAEIVGSGEASLGACILQTAAENLQDWMESPTASDLIVELASGGAEGVLLDAHNDAVTQLQDSIASSIAIEKGEGESLVDTHIGSRCLRRLILASQESSQTKQFAKKLWDAFESRGTPSSGHSKKVQDAFKQAGFK